jgi:preprotein translocase subunit SecA
VTKRTNQITNHLSTILDDVFLSEGALKESEIKGKDNDDIFEIVWAKVEVAFKDQKEKIGSQFAEFERMILLKIYR